MSVKVPNHLTIRPFPPFNAAPLPTLEAPFSPSCFRSVAPRRSSL